MRKKLISYVLVIGLFLNWVGYFMTFFGAQSVKFKNRLAMSFYESLYGLSFFSMLIGSFLVIIGALIIYNKALAGRRLSCIGINIIISCSVFLIIASCMQSSYDWYNHKSGIVVSGILFLISFFWGHNLFKKIKNFSQNKYISEKPEIK